MPPKLRGLATVDEAGRLIVPPELATRLGIIPGAQVRLDEEAYGGFLHRPVTQLAKVYIEPTSRCNLTCRTCIRNNWDELQGDMSAGVFEQVIAGLRALPAPPKVTFGGFGEPLTHPHISRDGPASEVGLWLGRTDHQRDLADPGAFPPADRCRAGCFMDLSGWRHARELLRRAPGSGFAQGAWRIWPASRLKSISHGRLR